jgi:hypothetical protein
MAQSNNTDDIWSSYGFADDEEDIWAEGFAIPVPKQSRTGVQRYIDWDKHPFTILMNDHRVYDPHSYHGKKFRRIFRVPYILFRDFIMKEVREKNFWEVKQVAGFISIYSLI